MENSIILKENEKIENLIYEIRGKQVMLDSDLAKLYECKSGTKDINNQAKLLNRIAEYAVLIFINRNYYKQFIISCDDEVMHYNKPLGTVIEQGIGLAEIDQSKHAEALKHARKLINAINQVK